MKASVKVIITHTAVNTTEFHLSADSTEHASVLIKHCRDLRSAEKLADKVLVDGIVTRDRYGSGGAVVRLPWKK